MTTKKKALPRSGLRLLTLRNNDRPHDEDGDSFIVWRETLAQCRPQYCWTIPFAQHALAEKLSELENR